MNRRPIKPTLYAGVPQVESQPPVQSLGTLRREIPSEVQPRENADPVIRFRPNQRPPMAIIELLDDGGDHGEEFRLRADSVTIGRTNTEIVVPHDSQMSGNHVKVSRRLVNSEYHWFLTDLSSTNGTFLRVAKSMLQADVPIIIGSYRYTYRPSGSPGQHTSPPTAPAGTRGWTAPTADDLKRLTAAMVRIADDGTELSFPLPNDGGKIGSDPGQCQIVISDDPTVNSVHAGIKLTDKGFVIEDNKSLNGIWTAVSERRLGNSAIFQIGEQRICFRVI
jgi:pSer/pThr/pTyr-binding forkhead associated (FHA) protein